MRIYVVGDSISIHYGPYLKTYLAGIGEYSRKEGEEEALLNLDRPQGANGGDSSMVSAFLESKAEHGGIDADLLVLNCGLHDIKTDPATGKRQIGPDEYARNLRRILEIAESLKTTPIWIRTTPCDERIHNHPEMPFHRFAADCLAYNAIADAIMAEAGVPSIDLYTFTRNLGDDLFCDHVHFHDHIRQKQAAFIAGRLSGFLPPPPDRAGRRRVTAL